MPGLALPVLLADADDTSRLHHSQWLERWGYQVRTIAHGAFLRRSIEQDGVALVVADWNLPGLGGVALCREIRSLQLSRHIYIILVGAGLTQQQLLDGLDAGADDILNKPVDDLELEARLQSAVRRLGVHDSLNQQTRELLQNHQHMERDMQAVARLQMGLLPGRGAMAQQQVHVDWLFVPSRYMSGDHMGALPLGEDFFGFYMLDVSGHGISAAVQALALAHLLTGDEAGGLLLDHSVQPPRPHRPSVVAGWLNRRHATQSAVTGNEMPYFTLLYGILHLRSGEGLFCQAGHPGLWCQRAHGAMEALGDGGYPIGLFADVEHEDTRFVLGPGDRLFLASDGVLEAMNAGQEVFGADRLRQTLVAARGGTLTAQLRHLGRRIVAWTGLDPSMGQTGYEDDVSVLALQWRQEAAAQGAEAPVILRERSLMPDVLPQTDSRAMALEASAPATPEVSPDAVDGAGLRVLVVDDSQTFSRLVESLLTAWRYEVRTASNGHAAVEQTRVFRPHIVLTDWDMPDMHGDQVCQAVRQLPLPGYVFMVVVTALSQRDVLLRCLRAGADDFLTKPLNPRELKVRLKAARRIIGLHEDLQRSHAEVQRVHDWMQADMEAVSELQQQLTATQRSADSGALMRTWLYAPQEVTGLQSGWLPLAPGVELFFMIDCPGRPLTAAIRAISMAQWLSDGDPVQRGLLADPGRPMGWRLPSLAGLLAAFAAHVHFPDTDQPLSLAVGWIDRLSGEVRLRVRGGFRASVLALPPASEDMSPAQLQAHAVARLPLAQDQEAQAQLEAGEHLCLSSAAVAGPQWLVSWLASGHYPGPDLQRSAAVLAVGVHAEMRGLAPYMAMHEGVEAQLLWATNWLALQQSRCVAQGSRPPEHMEGPAPERVLHIDCRLARFSIQWIGQAIAQLAQAEGGDELAAAMLELAVVEAATNLLRHGLVGQVANVEILATRSGAHVVVILQDQGQTIPQGQFDQALARLVERPEAEAPEALPEGGWGLALIQQSVRHWQYRVEDGLNQLVLWADLNWAPPT